MHELNTFAAASAVASCTLTAAHRRDHAHAHDAQDTGERPASCHPHAVEVVHLGDLAAMVCHDCRSDSGFVPYRDAWKLACAHRHDTDALPASEAA